jgi:hypothetical protein
VHSPSLCFYHTFLATYVCVPAGGHVHLQKLRIVSLTPTSSSRPFPRHMPDVCKAMSYRTFGSNHLPHDNIPNTLKILISVVGGGRGHHGRPRPVLRVQVRVLWTHDVCKLGRFGLTKSIVYLTGRPSKKRPQHLAAGTQRFNSPPCWSCRDPATMTQNPVRGPPGVCVITRLRLRIYYWISSGHSMERGYSGPDDSPTREGLVGYPMRRLQTSGIRNVTPLPWVQAVSKWG